MDKQNSTIFQGLLWKLLERFGVQGVQFLLQVILARILSPEHYGTLSLMTIFTALATVFIQQGFSTALIQNKNVKEEDYSSVLWVSLGIAGILYGILYVAAPAIAVFYEMPDLVAPFRTLCLMLFPGALNSVQLARVSREMNFKKVFYSNLAGIVVSGVVGIVIALLGGGLWALVIQTLLNTVIACVVMYFTSHLRLRLVCDFKRIGELFSFGWKLLTAALLDNLYQNLRSLVVGKKYDSGTLGYYDRGKQFPQFVINSINGAVQSVLLPAMSAQQDELSRITQMTRNSIVISSYIIFPMMAGLAGVASNLVTLLLTPKWLPCVPYLQIYCFSLAFAPVHTCNLQAMNALGRSDLFLKLEVEKKVVGIAAIVIAVFCFDSPIAIAVTGIVTSLVSCFINAWPNRELIHYSYLEQARDLMPSLLVSLVMCAAVLALNLLELPTLLLLVVQVAVGVVVYVALSALFRLRAFQMLYDMIRKRK